MGAKGRKEQPSERKRAALRENAKKPRLASRKGTPDGEQAVQRALQRIHGSLHECIDLAEQVLAGYVEYVLPNGTVERHPVTVGDRISVMKDFMDRGGLIKRQSVELSSDAVLPIEIVFKHGGVVKQ